MFLGQAHRYFNFYVGHLLWALNKMGVLKTEEPVETSMSIINRFACSVREGHILDAILDRAISVPHTTLVPVLSGGYIIEQNGVKADLSKTNLSPLIKYRLKKGRLEYEATEVEYINKYLQSEYDVVDLGAGMGFTSCAAGNKINHDRAIIAVEANENLKSTIERNATLNDVTIIPTIAAYAPRYESVPFFTRGDHRSASIRQDSSETTKVKTTDLSELVTKHNISEFQLISDIEGTEAELIHEMDLLSSCCRTLIIEIHKQKNPDVIKFVEELEKYGFKQVDSTRSVSVYRNTDF